ncbi:hypothetical protein KCP70_17440 [Salmonella enterica subsp. enterica]|nr:hypothetical protein KCP70_17440 [Salmonella enterica subsp. enterica]
MWLTTAISACWTWPIVPFMLRKTMAHERLVLHPLTTPAAHLFDRLAV